MRNIIVFFGFLAVLTAMTACVSESRRAEEYTPPVVVVAEPDENGVLALAEPVNGNSVNTLADTIGPVTITIQEDTSYASHDYIAGGRKRMVEFLGKKCLEVYKNYNNEIRIAFLLDRPTKLTGFSTLSFSIAGLSGAGGVYNCGLLYTDTKASGERIGSFYVSNVSIDRWTAVEAKLVEDEIWGNNFSGDRTLVCIQFWTNQADKIYIADLALR